MLLPVHVSAASQLDAAARHVAPAFPAVLQYPFTQLSTVHGFPSSLHEIAVPSQSPVPLHASFPPCTPP